MSERVAMLQGEWDDTRAGDVRGNKAVEAVDRV